MPEFRHRPLWLSEWTLATQRNPTTSSVNLSCASGLLLESILRSNDYQNGFHQDPLRKLIPAGERAMLAPIRMFCKQEQEDS